MTLQDVAKPLNLRLVTGSVFGALKHPFEYDCKAGEYFDPVDPSDHMRLVMIRCPSGVVAAFGAGDAFVFASDFYSRDLGGGRTLTTQNPWMGRAPTRDEKTEVMRRLRFYLWLYWGVS